MCQSNKIDSIEAFIKKSKEDCKHWGLDESPWLPWFRGEPVCDTPLLPRLYRGAPEDDYENRLLQYFRMKAPSLESQTTPNRSYTDQWLFLAQHVGLPTRLLDWTEGSLIALYFALQEQKPIVWMLNPFKMNKKSTPGETATKPYNVYALTWHTPKDKSINIGSANINAAWEGDRGGLDLPVAVHPTKIHPRMTVQRSCFTVHGRKKESICDLLTGEELLKKYIFNANNSKEMLEELRTLGISNATLFPDLDGLANDLTKLFRPDLV